MFSSYRNKLGLNGGNVKDGVGMQVGAKVEWNMEKKLREMGVSTEAWKNFQKGKDSIEREAAISDLTGWTLVPHDANGKKIATAVPVSWGGRTYNVSGDSGLKIVNEELLGFVADEAMEREEKLNDIVDLLLYVGDYGVAAIDKQLYQSLGARAGRNGLEALPSVLPSEIKNTTDSKTFGEKILALKRRVEPHLDRIVFPENVLEKVRSRRKGHSKSGEVDLRDLPTNQS